MNKIILSAVLLILISSSCKQAEDKAIDTTPSTDETVVSKEETPAPPMDEAAMTKAWENYATPGTAHKTLALDNGTWEEDMTMWMNADDKNPMKTKMTAESKMILGGRYQEMKHSGTVMGMPFEGIGTMGYDNASKQLVSSWVDNMGTGIMQLRGDYDGTSKTMELRGETTDPITGKQKAIRETYTIIDDNSRKMEMFDTDASGKEYKSMEILLKRKK